MAQSTNQPRHILTAAQYDVELIHKLFARADEIAASFDDHGRYTGDRTKLSRHILYRLFYKESTRTYESFGFAASHFGMGVLGTQSVQFSSVAKGETLEDTIRTICSYNPSMIVLRSAHAGEAQAAAAVSNVPIVNAGDGSGEHPTQALLDLYTIQRECGRTSNLHVVMGGDLANGRTVRSLTKLMIKFPDNHFTFISPPTFEMGEDVKAELTAAGIKFKETADLPEALASADVVYWTRVQKERITEAQNQFLHDHPGIEDHYTIGLEQMKHMNKSAKLLHPLPRVGEIKPEVDQDPRAVYFKQMHYGMLVRMALIEWVLGEDN